MQRFIAVAGTYNDHLLYFQPEELNLSKGTKVRITDVYKRQPAKLVYQFTATGPKS